MIKKLYLSQSKETLLADGETFLAGPVAVISRTGASVKLEVFMLHEQPQTNSVSTIRRAYTPEHFAPAVKARIKELNEIDAANIKDRDSKEQAWADMLVWTEAVTN